VDTLPLGVRYRTPTHLARALASAGIGVAALVALWFATARPAAAHQNPAGCDSNSVDVTPTRDKLLVRNGDVINYTVSLRNVDRDGQKACDLSDATVTLTLPAKDGTPSGQSVVLAQNADYPVGTSMTFPGTTKWTVDVNPGVKDAVVMVTVEGTLHDAPVDHAASIKKTLGTTVTQPHTTLSVSASPTTGRAPLTVVYTYTERNDSSTDVPITGVTLTDSNCAPVNSKTGDSNNNQVLDTGEAWTFSCSKTITQGGTFTSNVVGKGTSGVDTRAVADELAAVVVHVGQPHSTLTKTVTPDHGLTPLTAHYSYAYTNDGKDPISDLKLVDDKCAPVTYAGGDTNNNHVVDPGERWTFRCNQTFSTVGTFPNTVTATGIDTVDHLAVPPLIAHAQVVTTAVGVPVTSPPQVLGETVTKPPAPAPKTPARVAPSIMARTGVRIAVMVFAGLLAIGCGILLLAVSRRRRQLTST